MSESTFLFVRPYLLLPEAKVAFATMNALSDSG